MQTPTPTIYGIWDLAEDLASILVDILQLNLPIDDIAFTLTDTHSNPDDRAPIPPGSKLYSAAWAARPGTELDETTTEILDSSIPVRAVILTEQEFLNWEKVARHLALRAKG